MGKVRDGIKDDTAAMTQWVGRKLANHNPMRDRDPSAGRWASREPTRSGKEATVGLTEDNRAVYELANGRRFEVTVREVPADEELPELQPVGQ